MWIDCHAHLDRLPQQELTGILAEACTAGVSTVLSTATSLSSAASVVRHCIDFRQLYGAAGIAPSEVLSLPPDWEEELQSFLGREKIIAVGEIGIDKSKNGYPAMELQLPVFERQLHIAVQRDLPVVVHSRGVERLAAEICRASGVKKALFHCFTGSGQALGYILESGYHVSFSGIITFNSALAELAADVPLETLFIETDSPYLSPVPHRGKTNRPAWVVPVGEALARCKKVTSEQLQITIEKNFKELFDP
jgi:TatD DNase family protein